MPEFCCAACPNEVTCADLLEAQFARPEDVFDIPRAFPATPATCTHQAQRIRINQWRDQCAGCGVWLSAPDR